MATRNGPETGTGKTFVLYPSRTKQILLLLVCAVFISIGILMIREGNMFGWILAGFFGLGIPVSLLQLIPGSSFLKLSEEGIEIRSVYRSFRFQWSHIEGFHLGRISGARFVLMDFTTDYPRARTMRKISGLLTGAEGALPNVYGYRPKELIEILNEWKAASRNT